MQTIASISSWYANNETLIQEILIYALLAFSIQVALRSGIFSLAGVGFYAIGSYAAGLLVKEQAWPTALAVIAAVLLCALLGWALSVLLVRLRDLYLALATVAFDLMVGVVALNWSSLTGGPLGTVGIPISVTTLTIFITVLGAAAMLALMQRGTIGRTLVAVREDEQLARSLSVNVRRYRELAFVISSMLGALAGAYHALLFTDIQATDAGFELIVLALTMVVIGGFGSWTGALLGAILLTWIPIELTSIGQWWDAVYGAMMIVVATFIPGGLISLVTIAGRASRGRARPSLLRRGSAAAAPPASSSGA